MSGTDNKPIPGEPLPAQNLVKPEATHWLWRPWYAKSWWTAAIIFWLIAFLAPNLSMDANHIAPLILLFHPFLIVPVLGFGFFRAWIRYHFEVKAEHGPDSSARRRHQLPRMDPTDPADSSYYGHPGNPLSEAWRNEHVRGIH